MKRLPRAALALVAMSPLIAGCGGGTGDPALATNRPVTRAEAVTYAEEVNLDPADLPGWTGTGLEEESKPTPTDSAEARCTGGPSPTRALVARSSPQFRRGSGFQAQQVKSGVGVFPSLALADQSLAIVKGAIHDARTRGCLLKFARKGIAKGFARGIAPGISYSFGALTLAPLPHSVPDSFAFRVLIPLSFQRAGGVPYHTHIYLDYLGFATGPADISLLATGFGNPVSAATERNLLSVLHGRATS
jgi:hypothetical protein